LAASRRAQPLGVDVDDQRDEQDQAADEDLEEAVDLDVVEAVVEDAEHEQADDRIADAAAPAEQAGAADHHGGDGVEQESVEFVLLGAAEIGDADHAGEARAHGGDHHHRADDEADIDAGIFRRLAIAADHVNVAAEARIGQHEMGDEQEDRRDDDDPWQAEKRLGSERQNERRYGVGYLPPRQNHRNAGADLHHGERHDEGWDADAGHAEGGQEAKRAARQQRENDGDRAGHRQIGNVHVVRLQREEGEHDRRGVGDRAHGKVDLRRQDNEGEAHGHDRR